MPPLKLIPIKLDSKVLCVGVKGPKTNVMWYDPKRVK